MSASWRHGTPRGRPNLGALGDQELAAGAWRRWAPRLEETLLDVVRVTSAYQDAAVKGVLILKNHPAPLALLARLVAPEPVSVSTRQMEDLVELARALRGWTGIAGFLETIGPEHALRQGWCAALPGELWARTEQWLKAYGHRGPNESDLAQPRFTDDLRLLAAALRPLVLDAEAPEAVEARRERRRADHAAAWTEVNEAFGLVARLRLRAVVRDLGKLMVVRESLRSAFVLHNHAGRVRLVEMGRRLVARDRLDAPEEVLQLTLEEAERALLDPAFDARTAVARERARVAAWRRIEVPNRFTTEEIGAFGRVGVAAASAEATLRGTAVSPGEVEGRVCVLRSPDDEEKMLRGAILVAPTTDPGWTPLFARAAGIVVELGGVMSHAGTVAREYGLPGRREQGLRRVQGPPAAAVAAAGWPAERAGLLSGGGPAPFSGRPLPAADGRRARALGSEPMRPATKPRLGVSSCLLGRNVRYDGGHKRDPFCVEVLGEFVEWIPVCPEVEVGMPVPRPSIRLVGRAEAPRLVAQQTGDDWTERMQAWAEARVAALAAQDLSGFVLKKDSPSCGMARVRVYSAKGGAPSRDGAGAFARVLQARLPLLPVEEEGRLHDPLLRESFIERIFAFARWKALRQGGLTRGRLVEFHTAHKLSLLAHGPEGYRRLGRLVAGAAGRPLAEVAEAYGALFMATLAAPATRGRHRNVLQHMAGYFKRLEGPDRKELEEAVADYGRGHVPLVVPLTLFRSAVRRHGVEYLAGQTYLDPDPKELMLRNHA